MSFNSEVKKLYWNIVSKKFQYSKFNENLVVPMIYRDRKGLFRPMYGKNREVLKIYIPKELLVF